MKQGAPTPRMSEWADKRRQRADLNSNIELFVFVIVVILRLIIEEDAIQSFFPVKKRNKEGIRKKNKSNDVAIKKEMQKA